MKTTRPSATQLANAIREASAANERLLDIVRAYGVNTPAQAVEIASIGQHLGDGWNCTTCGQSYPCPTVTAAIEAELARTQP